MSGSGAKGCVQNEVEAVATVNLPTRANPGSARPSAQRRLRRRQHGVADMNPDRDELIISRLTVRLRGRGHEATDPVTPEAQPARCGCNGTSTSGMACRHASQAAARTGSHRRGGRPMSPQPCPIRGYGHSGDTICDRSGWRVTPGNICWRCAQPPPLSNVSA